MAPTLVTLVSGALGGAGFIRYALMATNPGTSIVAAVGFISAARTH